jgi:uncharacterized protein YkwD
MVSFELTRFGGVSEMAREARTGKFVPVYVAALLAGGALGVGLVMATQASPETVSRSGIEAPAITVPANFAAPGVPAAGANAETSGGVVYTGVVELPADFMAVVVAPVTAEAPPAQPVAATNPVAAAVPVKPVPVAQQPQTQPAPAPVVAPAPAVAPAPVQPAKPNFYVPPVSAGGITELEQRLLNGINAERAAAGLSAYAYDAGLARVGRTRVQQMVDQGYFAHRDPYGYSMYVELLAHFGYSSYAWAGENLALNNYAIAESPERALISLMKSPTHRANILSGDFSRIGIGQITTADGKHYYAMIFLG